MARSDVQKDCQNPIVAPHPSGAFEYAWSSLNPSTPSVVSPSLLGSSHFFA